MISLALISHRNGAPSTLVLKCQLCWCPKTIYQELTMILGQIIILFFLLSLHSRWFVWNSIELQNLRLNGKVRGRSNCSSPPHSPSFFFFWPLSSFLFFHYSLTDKTVCCEVIACWTQLVGFSDKCLSFETSSNTHSKQHGICRNISIFY